MADCRITEQGFCATDGRTAGFDLLAGCLYTLATDNEAVTCVADAPAEVKRCKDVIFATLFLVQGVAFRVGNIALPLLRAANIAAGILKLKPSDTKIIRLTGHLSTSDADSELAELESFNVDLILDFQDVQSITSMGLGSLLVLRRKLAEKGGTLAIINVSDQVWEVFDVSHLTQLLNVQRG
jgi:anti-anti-sigma factor